jgi:glycosyltransferase involved in cell wall biosynthesis
MKSEHRSSSAIMISNNEMPGYHEYLVNHIYNYVEVNYRNPYGYSYGPVVRYTEYEGGKEARGAEYGARFEKFLRAVKRIHPVFLEPFIAFLVLVAAFKSRTRFDLMIIASVSPIAPFLVRSRKARYVVFCSVDLYLPPRNSIIQKLSFTLIAGVDEKMQNWPDEVWYLSEQLLNAKTSRRSVSADVLRYIVPFPITPSSSDDSAVRRHDCVYFGTIAPGLGLTTIVRALKQVAEAIPDVKLIIIGQDSRGFADELRTIVSQLDVSHHVRFLGFLKLPKVREELSKCALGFAIYESNQIFYTDSTKIKLYLSAGIPVVTTARAAIAGRIREFGAGVVFEPAAESLAAIVVRLMTDESFWLQCREGVRELNKELIGSDPLESRIRSLLGVREV